MLSFRHKFLLLVVSIGLALQLSACTPEQNELHLMKHPRALKALLRRCEKMDSARQSQDPACIQAFQASKQLQQMLDAWQASPERFGQQIIHHQIELAKLKQQLAASKPGSSKRAELTAKVNDLDNHINEMLAVTALVGE